MKRTLQLLAFALFFSAAFPAIAYFEYHFSTDLVPEYSAAETTSLETREWPSWIGRMGDDIPEILVFTGGMVAESAPSDWPSWIGR